MDCEIELAEEFQPSGLAACQELSGEEVFQVFVVYHDIYERSRTFQIMTPAGECLKDHQELLIMSIVVQLCSGKGAEVKSNRVDLIVGANDGEDGSNSIARGISLYHDRSIGGPVNKHQCRGKCILQVKKELLTVIREVPENSFMDEVGERDHNVRVALDEPAVEVGEAKEGLNVLDLPWLRPIENCLDFVMGRRKPRQGEEYLRYSIVSESHSHFSNLR